MWLWWLIIVGVAMILIVLIRYYTFRPTWKTSLKSAIVSIIVSLIFVFGCKGFMDTGLLWTMFPAPPVAQGYTNTFLQLVESCGENATDHYSNHAEFDHNRFVLCMESNGIAFSQNGDPVK